MLWKSLVSSSLRKNCDSWHRLEIQTKPSSRCHMQLLTFQQYRWLARPRRPAAAALLLAAVRVGGANFFCAEMGKSEYIYPRRSRAGLGLLRDVLVVVGVVVMLVDIFLLLSRRPPTIFFIKTKL